MYTYNTLETNESRKLFTKLLEQATSELKENRSIYYTAHPQDDEVIEWISKRTNCKKYSLRDYEFYPNLVFESNEDFVKFKLEWL